MPTDALCILYVFSPFFGPRHRVGPEELPLTKRGAGAGDEERGVSKRIV